LDQWNSWIIFGTTSNRKDTIRRHVSDKSTSGFIFKYQHSVSFCLYFFCTCPAVFG